MKIIRRPQEMQRLVLQNKKKGRRIGFVPTMGALHEGHLSLIRRARKNNDFTVVSVFINPTQFGAGEDFKKYPRNLARDARLCRQERVDVLFSPDAPNMYPQDYKTYVEVKGVSDILCGELRPGHFRGVATVVAKLFNIVQPDIAYLGQKDAQQAIIIKKMAADLNMPVKIQVMPIVREKDGLAMSSRNIYLNKKERIEALALSNSLNLARDLIRCKEIDAAAIARRMKQLIEKRKSARIDYIAIVDQENLKPLKKITNNCLLVLAVRIGKTRLIDNTVVKL